MHVTDRQARFTWALSIVRRRGILSHGQIPCSVVHTLCSETLLVLAQTLNICVPSQLSTPGCRFSIDTGRNQAVCGLRTLDPLLRVLPKDLVRSARHGTRYNRHLTSFASLLTFSVKELATLWSASRLLTRNRIFWLGTKNFIRGWSCAKFWDREQDILFVVS